MAASYTTGIADDVRDVLERSVITTESLTLPPGQLERTLYERVNKVLVAAGGKWNRKAKAHVFARDPREVLGLALETGGIVNTAKAMQQFFTPSNLATKLAASIQPGQRVLEPSAGAGSLALAARRMGATVDCVELDANYASDLDNYHAFSVRVVDFLTIEPCPEYDAVLMNPPFTKGQDIQHVTHALKFLKRGGHLTAVMSAGVKFRDDKATKTFRALVDANNGKIVALPEDSFVESGTAVNTVVVTMTRS